MKNKYFKKTRDLKENGQQKQQEMLRVVTIAMICSTLDLYITETYI